MEVKYYRTNVNGRKPNANDIEYGEIAVNYNSTNPRIMTKDSNNTIANFLPESKINSMFNDVNGTLNDLDEDVQENAANITTINTWMNTPITIDEINSLFRKKIKFIVNGTGTEHQAEEGMTWGEWVGSEYNVYRSFEIDPSDNTVYYGSRQVSNDKGLVFVSDIIQEGYDYVLIRTS